jgi:hypothetical protein
MFSSLKSAWEGPRGYTFSRNCRSLASVPHSVLRIVSALLGKSALGLEAELDATDAAAFCS